MLWFTRFTSRIVGRTPAALALSLIAAAACTDRESTAPLRTATARASRDDFPSCPLLYLTFYPRSLTFPGIATGTITLRSAAPAPGGYRFTAAVNRTDLAYVDPIIVAPAGATTVTFQVRTLASPTVGT